MSISPISPGISPLFGMSPASSRSQSPARQPQFGAGEEDTFTPQATAAGINRPPSPATVQQTLDQADDFVEQMNQYTQRLQAGMPALPPTVGPHETFQDSTKLLNDLRARQPQQNPFAQQSTTPQPEPDPLLDGFAPDFPARLETLSGLKGQNIQSYFNQQTEALKAKQAQENKALTQRLGIQDTPELREELAKQGMSPEEIEALIQKTGVQPPAPSQQAA